MPPISSLLKKQKYHIVNLKRVLREQSFFKILFILGFIVFLEGGLFLLFHDGFRFLDTLAGVGALIVDRLFSLFYLGTGCMLVLSSVITSYSTLFRSDEVSFLLFRPYRMSHIVVYKFFESTCFSSWAFAFIVIPFIGSYAWYHKMTVLFAIWTLLFSIPFLLLCSGLGMLLVLLAVRWGPRGRALKYTVLSISGAIIAWIWWLSWDIYDPAASVGREFNIARLIPGIQFASSQLNPSWWIAEGSMCMTRGQWTKGFMLWLLLCSSSLMITAGVEWIGSLSFYKSWQNTLGSNDREHRCILLFPKLDRLLTILPHDIRAMAMKDIRIFFRDPMQWSQSLIFFGLLTLYYMNLRSFRYEDFLAPEFLVLICYLNVFGVSAVMCSLSARFIYPQLSLEGQGFWLLGLSPTSMKRIVCTKFIVATISLVTISVVLMLLSARMLNVSTMNRWIAVGLVISVSVAITGLSTGLGAIFLNLKQQNPMAIVSGFGGTLNLVLSLGFILATILPFGFLSYIYAIERLSYGEYLRGLGMSGLWVLCLTIAAATIPMQMGTNSLIKRDY